MTYAEAADHLQNSYKNTLGEFKSSFDDLSPEMRQRIMEGMVERLQEGGPVDEAFEKADTAWEFAAKESQQRALRAQMDAERKKNGWVQTQQQADEWVKNHELNIPLWDDQARELQPQHVEDIEMHVAKTADRPQDIPVFFTGGLLKDGVMQFGMQGELSMKRDDQEVFDDMERAGKDLSGAARDMIASKDPGDDDLDWESLLIAANAWDRALDDQDMAKMDMHGSMLATLIQDLQDTGEFDAEIATWNRARQKESTITQMDAASQYQFGRVPPEMDAEARRRLIAEGAQSVENSQDLQALYEYNPSYPVHPGDMLLIKESIPDERGKGEALKSEVYSRLARNQWERKHHPELFEALDALPWDLKNQVEGFDDHTFEDLASWVQAELTKDRGVGNTPKRIAEAIFDPIMPAGESPIERIRAGENFGRRIEYVPHAQQGDLEVDNEGLTRGAPTSQRGQLRLYGYTPEEAIDKLEELGIVHELEPEVPFRAIMGSDRRHGIVLPILPEYLRGEAPLPNIRYSVGSGITSTSSFPMVLKSGGLLPISERIRLGLVSGSGEHTTSPLGDIRSGIDGGVFSVPGRSKWGNDIKIIYKDNVFLRRDVILSTQDYGGQATRYGSYARHHNELRSRAGHSPASLFSPLGAKERQIQIDTYHIENVMGGAEWNPVGGVPIEDWKVIEVSDDVKKRRLEEQLDQMEAEGLITERPRVVTHLADTDYDAHAVPNLPPAAIKAQLGDPEPVGSAEPKSYGQQNEEAQDLFKQLGVIAQKDDQVYSFNDNGHTYYLEFNKIVNMWQIMSPSTGGTVIHGKTAIGAWNNMFDEDAELDETIEEVKELIDAHDLKILPSTADEGYKLQTNLGKSFTLGYYNGMWHASDNIGNEAEGETPKIAYEEWDQKATSTDALMDLLDGKPIPVEDDPVQQWDEMMSDVLINDIHGDASAKFFEGLGAEAIPVGLTAKSFTFTYKGHKFRFYRDATWSWSLMVDGTPYEVAGATVSASNPAVLWNGWVAQAQLPWVNLA